MPKYLISRPCEISPVTSSIIKVEKFTSCFSDVYCNEFKQLAPVDHRFIEDVKEHVRKFSHCKAEINVKAQNSVFSEQFDDLLRIREPVLSERIERGVSCEDVVGKNEKSGKEVDTSSCLNDIHINVRSACCDSQPITKSVKSEVTDVCLEKSIESSREIGILNRNGTVKEEVKYSVPEYNGNFNFIRDLNDNVSSHTESNNSVQIKVEAVDQMNTDAIETNNPNAQTDPYNKNHKISSNYQLIIVKTEPADNDINETNHCSFDREMVNEKKALSKNNNTSGTPAVEENNGKCINQIDDRIEEEIPISRRTRKRPWKKVVSSDSEDRDSGSDSEFTYSDISDEDDAFPLSRKYIAMSRKFNSVKSKTSHGTSLKLTTRLSEQTKQIVPLAIPDQELPDQKVPPILEPLAEPLPKPLRSTIKNVPTKTHGKVKCPACPVHINHRSLQKHIYNHNRDKSFGCNNCDQKFKTAGAMCAHELTHNNNNIDDGKENPLKDQVTVYKCSVCKIPAHTVLELKTHNCYTYVEFKCAQCPKAFFYKRDRDYHERGHQKGENTLHDTSNVKEKSLHDKNEASSEFPDSKISAPKRNIPTTRRTFNCSICLKRFFKNHDLKKHIWKHGRDKSFSCKVCNQKFGTAGTMCAHELTHKNTKLENIHSEESNDQAIYKCTACNVLANTVLGLETHICFNMTEEFKCLHCPKIFAFKSNRDEHTKCHLPRKENGKSYTCALCNKIFCNGSAMKRHERIIHNGVKLLKCKVCKRRFLKIENLENHQCIKRKRYPMEKVECPLCHRIIINAQALKNHLMGHTGEKRFMCESCGKKFLTKVGLSNHSASHSEERVHLCHFCAKSFKTEMALQRHVASVHNKKESSFHCDMCNKDFTPRDNYVRHLRTHTGEKPYECKICGHRAIQCGTLKSHIKVHHKGALISNSILSHFATSTSV